MTFDEALRAVTSVVELFEADNRLNQQGGLDVPTLTRIALKHGISETTLGRVMELLGFERARVWRRQAPSMPTRSPGSHSSANTPGN